MIPRAPEAIGTKLLGDVTVNNRVSGRIYPHSAPQAAARPYIIYALVGLDGVHHLRGASGLAMSNVQVTAYADTYETAQGLSEAARLVLDGYRGNVPVVDAIVPIRMCHLNGRSDGTVPPQDASDKPIYFVSHDYRVAEFETINQNPRS